MGAPKMGRYVVVEEREKERFKNMIRRVRLGDSG